MEDHREIQVLMELTFGPREGANELLRKWLTTSDFSAFVAVENRIIGFSLARLEIVDAVSGFFFEHKVGSFQTLLILPEFRRKQVGENLSQAQLKWMIDQGCTAASGNSWNHGGEGTSSHLFIKGGFEKLGEVQDFYLEGSRKTDHVCPTCEGTCHCSSTLYGKILKSPPLKHQS